MKAVLLSIRPEWCEKIASGEKTVEVRKTRPVRKMPFKVYIYCTMRREGWFRHPGSESWCGKVVGEFVCDKIDRLTHVDKPSRLNIVTPDLLYKPADDMLESACMSGATAEKYLKGGDGYGWHISDLKIYDHPRELRAFTGLQFTRFGMWSVEIQRPPQSWRYVEELECT